MKSNFLLFGGAVWLAAASVLAQAPARESNAPAVSRLVTGPVATNIALDPPWTGTVKIESLQVRDQPAFAGDVLRIRLVKGQTVTVLEKITLAKPQLNEPTNWARIILPTNTPVWVFAEYINTNTMTVTGRRVNVRGGPSDAYGVVALLERGATVKQVRRNEDWIQIEPPANASGFVASDYLTMQPPVALIAAAPAAPEAAVLAATNTASATNATNEATNTTSAVASVASAPPAPEIVALAGTNATTGTSAIYEGTNTTSAAAPVASGPPAPEIAALAGTNTTNRTDGTNEATNATSAAGAPPQITYQWSTLQGTNATLAAVPAPPIIAPEPVATTPPAAAGPAETTPAAAPVAGSPAATAPVATSPVATAPAPAPPAAIEPASVEVKPRVVTREGIVGKSLNVKAPTDYELHEVTSKRVIEYLLPDAQDKTFKKYDGKRVFVTGTEWLDPGWPQTPILRIQSVEVLEGTNNGGGGQPGITIPYSKR